MKIAILLPDGVGLRNFIYSDFIKQLENDGHEVVVWNATVFDMGKIGFAQIPLSAKINPITDLYKNVRKKIELERSYRETKNEIYLSYLFKSYASNSLKDILKRTISNYLYKKHKDDDDSLRIIAAMERCERQTKYYKECLKQLKENRIDYVLCVNQRHIVAIAPIVAARDFGIPTASFIYSWDNLPKATMVVNTDYYMVWSDYMKKELLQYYPYLKSENIFVVGTPQFAPHYNQSLLKDKKTFCAKFGIPLDRRYICFTGDDITTSPNDPIYLRDIAEVVKNHNLSHKEKWGILFRRCPVDFSDRYDFVLDSYKDEVFPINPIWKNEGNGWDAAMPLAEDTELLVNTIHHCEFTINLGSSIVFDASIHDIPTCYINYDIENGLGRQSVKKIYSYIHFQSMPSKDSVYWIQSMDDVRKALENDNWKENVVKNSKKWMDVICYDSQNAITNLCKAIHSRQKSNK